MFKTPIEVILHLEPVGLQLLDILRLQSIKQLLLAIIISLIIEVGAINFVWAKSHFARKTTSWLLVMQHLVINFSIILLVIVNKALLSDIIAVINLVNQRMVSGPDLIS